MRVLVTGASGMLGAATVAALAARGDRVTVLQRRRSGLPHPEVLADVADVRAVAAAAAGHEAVIHLAAKVDVVGPWHQYVHSNILGTRSVLSACVTAGVSRLVHVSSPSVAHTGAAIVGAAAEPADPERARGHYSRSKAAAERLVLATARDTDGPHVVVIRPHLVWGPGDPQLVDRIVARARAGRLFVVGTGAALIDTTYVANAADSLVAALDRCSALHGSALVVSDGTPLPIAELIAAICRATGVPPPRRAVPVPVATVLGAVADLVWAGLPWVRHRGDPPITRFLAEQLSTAHWFDQRATRELLRWTPRVDLETGLASLADPAARP